MILVLLGTCRQEFQRLARAVEDYSRLSGEDIHLQLGFTSYVPAGVTCYDFLFRERLFQMIEAAELVICHGGFATLCDCLERHKKIVAVPRKKELGESLDSGFGQEEIVRQLERTGRLVGVYDIRTLPEAIEEARRLPDQPMGSSRIPELIEKYVSRLLD